MCLINLNFKSSFVRQLEQFNFCRKFKIKSHIRQDQIKIHWHSMRHDKQGCVHCERIHKWNIFYESVHRVET